KRVYVCINKKGGKACIGPKSRAVFRALHKRARERGGEIEVERIVCMGYCSHGPNVKIHGGDFFHEVSVDDVDDILDAVT
ncbi:MAG: (2Fe-2S) ferredoxin domain-containing protein, partial [Rhodospirillaceae bacterium]|nr:(2Fe-2S) ferredoxin domain-containing protein [Rhodospirillaceae bacterium]